MTGLRIPAFVLALGVAGCTDSAEPVAETPAADDADAEKSNPADDSVPAGAGEGARADDSGGPDDDLYAPFVDPSRRARRDAPDGAPRAKPAPKAAASPEKLKAASEDSTPKTFSGAGTALTTEDGRKLQVKRGGQVSGASLRRSR